MIAIISCTKSKYQGKNNVARQVYWKSNLFRLSYAVIKKLHPDAEIHILSAKYGLIKETEIIDSYEKTVKDMSNAEKEAFKQTIDCPKEYIFIGGSEYKKVLSYPPTVEYGAGLPIGKKMAYLKKLL